MHNLLERMKEYGSSEFNVYYDHVYVDTVAEGFLPCDANCKAAHLCGIQHVNYDHFDVCYYDNVDVDSASALASSMVVLLGSFLLYLL